MSEQSVPMKNLPAGPQILELRAVPSNYDKYQLIGKEKSRVGNR